MNTTARARRFGMTGKLSQQRGFSLIEIVTAVLILTLLAFSLHSFVSSNLDAVRISQEFSADKLAMTGLMKMLETELADLPSKGQSVLLGTPHKFNNVSKDEMQWVCRPGEGVLTTAAEGEYRVTLRMRPVTKTSSIEELVLVRRPIDGTEKDETSITLMSPVQSLQIRYFHPQLNTVVDRWTDQATRPSLVYVSLQRTPEDEFYEVVLTVPGAMLQQ